MVESICRRKISGQLACNHFWLFVCCVAQNGVHIASHDIRISQSQKDKEDLTNHNKQESRLKAAR